MKNLITLVGVFSLLLFSTNTKAQGNLQFNQVINDQISLTALGFSTNLTGSQIIVPPGKVWKIESIGIGPHYIGLTNITLGGQFVYSNSSEISFPIWLSEGTYSTYGKNSSTNTSAYFSYSALEFNVVP